MFFVWLIRISSVVLTRFIVDTGFNISCKENSFAHTYFHLRPILIICKIDAVTVWLSLYTDVTMLSDGFKWLDLSQNAVLRRWFQTNDQILNLPPISAVFVWVHCHKFLCLHMLSLCEPYGKSDFKEKSVQRWYQSRFDCHLVFQLNTMRLQFYYKWKWKDRKKELCEGIF